MDLIIFVIICILIINLFNKQKNIENFDNTVMNKVKTRIDALYGVRLQYIRDFISKIKNLNINDTTIQGNLNIMGSFNLLPKGTIIMFNSKIPPDGWALCDGGTYEGFVTPDLRGKFIRMWTDSTTALEGASTQKSDYNSVFWAGRNNRDARFKLLSHNINDTAGSDLIHLTIDDIPEHNHILNNYTHTHATTNLNKWGRSWKDNSVLNFDRIYYRSVENTANTYTLNTGPAGAHTHTLDNTGNSESFNNQPPYYVLSFIIRYK
jgi:microcystin-dependent protein